MPRTWIGVACPGCGHVTPVLAAGRVLRIGDSFTEVEKREVHRVADEGVRCPDCQCDLREGTLAACSPPPHIDVRP